jgi:hypothetical protein
LAPQVMETYSLTRERSLLPLLVGGWMLDYKSPAVFGIHQNCAARLLLSK